MKSLLFIAIISICLFLEVILKKNNKNNRRKSKSKTKSKTKTKITKGKKRQYSFEKDLPSPPQYPNYGSLAVPNYPGLTTTLTTGTYSSGGNLYQAKPGDAIPYGTGYSYGNWQKIEMN